MQKPIAPGLFTEPPHHPQLVGGECSDCAATTFPAQERCPRCGQASMEEVLLPTRGTLVSWTTQEFAPVLPYAGDETGKSFAPFGVGLVQLADKVRVEARLTESDPGKLDFGMEVELQLEPFYVDDEGAEIVTFAFAPVSSPDTVS